MIEVTFYNEQSGEITRMAMLSEDMVDANAFEGESWLEGFHSHQTHKVVDGNVVPKGDTELNQVELKDAWASLKQERGARLFSSDWTQVPDAPVDQAAWATYRQALRDLPANTTDPGNPFWPEPPN